MKWKTGVSIRAFAELNDIYGQTHSPSLSRIFGLVEAAGCKTIVIEDDVEEEEYASEYRECYSQVFETAGKAKPTRVHFFRGIVTRGDVVDKDARYLGYCDIRPTRCHTISAALIDYRVFATPGSRFLYFICKSTFDVPFANRMLSVPAFPYVQQDGLVIRCGQAALASIAKYYKIKMMGPEFTQIAASVFPQDRSVPSKGIDPIGVGLSFRKLEREPVFYDYTQKDRKCNPEQVIYRYLESGVPVLLSIRAGNELHSLVVIGHSFSPDSWFAHTSTRYYSQPKTGSDHHCSTNWIEKFIVQDDNLGPYTLAPVSFAGNTVLQGIMVPFRRGINILGEDAEMFVAELLNSDEGQFVLMLQDKVQELHRKKKNRKFWHTENQFWFKQFVKNALPRELVLRTFMRRSEDWRRSMLRDYGDTSIPSVLEGMPLPEHIWVVEISWPDIFVHGRRFCGEVIVDPTTRLLSGVPGLQQGWLWLHVAGIVATRNAKNGLLAFGFLRNADPPRRHHQTNASNP